jgi:transcriptional regulator with XRE-family HTH domain
MDQAIMNTTTLPVRDEYKPTLLPAVVEELGRRRGTWREICAETGINYSTLQKIAQGQVTNPGVNTVELLHDYLLPDNRPAA